MGGDKTDKHVLLKIIQLYFLNASNYNIILERKVFENVMLNFPKS